MKGIRYSKDVDILLIELSGGAVDHATEAGPFVVHFSKRGVPVLLEILNASKVLESLQKAVQTRNDAKVAVGPIPPGGDSGAD